MTLCTFTPEPDGPADDRGFECAVCNSWYSQRTPAIKAKQPNIAFDHTTDTRWVCFDCLNGLIEARTKLLLMQ